MFYSIARPFVKIALSVYFRKIYFDNMEVLPKNKPVILATNHPTAFIEPIILACWMDRPLNFLARGDLYVKSLLFKKIYDWCHMTPVFRREDTGYSNLKNNYGTFEKCYETLRKHTPLMILVEGQTKHEKRLRPMRKGTARIVFGALEKYGDMDIHIVPVGVTYTNPDDFRSVAMLEFGQPIRCTEYTRMYKEHPAKAIKLLTREMGARLKNQIVHIEKKEDEQLVEQLLKLAENEWSDSLLPISSKKNNLFIVQKNIADTVNNMEENEKRVLKEKISGYFEKLKKYRLSDYGLMHRNISFLKNFLLVVLGFLPAMLGYILNALPIYLGNALAKKIAPSIEFRAASAIVFSSFFYFLYGVTLYLGGYLLGYGWSVLWLLLVPVLGYFYILYGHIFKKWEQARHAAKLSKEQLEELLSERKRLMVGG